MRCDSFEAVGEPKVKVLYIAGAGRSGSTILGNILGQYAGLVYMGELRYIWERGLVEDRLCSCGAPFRSCPVWQGIVTSAFGGIDQVDPRRMMRLQLSGTRARHVPLIPAHRALGRTIGSRLQEYPDVLSRLYAAVQARTGARVIVDSSKLPTYGYLVGELPNVRLYVLHLLRDPRATAYSWARKKSLPDRRDGGYMQRQGPLKSAMLWGLWNSVAEVLWAKPGETYLRVRYEDFVRSPRPTIQRILDMVGERPDNTPFLSDRDVRLQTTHTVAGNPSRFDTGAVQIRADDEWRQRMLPARRVLVGAVTWPLRVRLGYGPRRP